MWSFRQFAKLFMSLVFGFELHHLSQILINILLANFLTVNLFYIYKLKTKSKLRKLNFTFSPTDNSPMALQENSHQLCESSNLGYDFNINLNKTFDLNKCDEQLKASGGINAILEPFNKLTFDCTNQKKNVPRKLSEFESDESLGILPDLLNDEMTFDLFKTELGFSENEIHDVFNPEINENPASSVFSPPSDNQFNRISLFLKNISTPLPNFVNDRRCSSTPKILPACQFVSQTNTFELDSSSSQFLDEKEEPIIAGSCRIKFETDFNLDDLKNGKPLTSTYKALSLPPASLVLNELNEENDLKSKVNFQGRPESIENNLNVTQTFTKNVEDLFPCEHEESLQNVNVLNNTFNIRSNNCSEKEKVKILDSTFAIPGNEISCNVDNEKTFLIDFNSTVGAEASSKSIYKDRMLNETHVLEMDSIESFSKQQEQIANVTFTKELENDTQTGLENHCYNSQGMAFKPMTQILEETFSENELNEMQARTKNVPQCVNSLIQSVSPDKFKPNVTFSEKVAEILPKKRLTQNDNYPIEFESSNSPKALPSIFHEEAEEKVCFQYQINLTENENDSASKIELFNSLQSVGDTFSEKIYERDDQEIDTCHKTGSVENDSLIELASSKALASTTFNEEMGGKIYFYNQINLAENENIPANKTSHSDPLQSISDAIFSGETNERSDQSIDKFFRRYSMPDENPSKLASFMLSKVSKRFTISGRSEEANFLGSSVSKDSNDIVEKDTPNLQPISRTAYSLALNKFDNCLTGNNFSEVIEDSVFTANPSEEIEICTHSVPIENCSLEIVSNTCVNTFPANPSEEIEICNHSVPIQDCSLEIVSNSSNTCVNTTFPVNPSEEIEICTISVPIQDCSLEIVSNLSNTCVNTTFPANPSEEIEICTHSVPIEDCSLEIVSNTCVNTTFPEKNHRLRAATNAISTNNDQVQISQNSLVEMSNSTFSEKTGEVQIELYSIPTEKDNFRSSLNSPKEITNASFSKSSDKNIKVQHEVHLNKYNRSSVGETASSNLTNLCLKDALSKKATDKHNSSLKSCLLESKTVVKSGLIKPTRIVYPRMVSEQRVGYLPIAKPIIHKRPMASDFNRTLILSDNSSDKPFSKDSNRKLSLPCSSASSDNKSKCKNDFKKPFEIPSKLGIKKPTSSYQKSRLDSKYSNGHLKNIATVNKQNSLSQPDLISDKNPKIAKSVASVYGKGRPLSSRLSLHEKLPMKSFKMKECGLKANTAVTDTVEMSANTITSCPKVIDLPRKETVPEVKINNANLVKNSSRLSIAKNLPRKFPTSLSNIPNKTCYSKPTVIKQKSVPAVNSYEFDSVKAPNSEKVPKSIAKLKFSSLPKVQSPIKISCAGNENKSAVDKAQSSRNQKSKDFIMKPCVPEGEAMQLVKTQISTGHQKQKDDIRDSNRLDSSIGPTSSKQAVQPSNTLNVMKSKGKCNFLPMPKIIKDVKSVSLNVCTAQESVLQNKDVMKSKGKCNFLPMPKIIKDVKSVSLNVCTAQESLLQNKVCRQTSGKLPQFRRIPAPRFNK